MQEHRIKYNPLVSIILPVYNGGKFLAQSIESCLNQSYKNIELIIVYEHSIDNTLAITNKYASLDSRVKLIINDDKKNLPAALNIGHYAAIGDFFSWTSDDNIYESDAIEFMLEALFDKRVDVVYSNMIVIDEAGEKCRDFNFLNFENTIFRNYIGNCFLYKKEVFERNKGYDENCFLVEDYDFWLRAVAHSRFYQFREKLYRYRKHDTSLTHQIAFNDEKKQLWNENVVKMYEAFSRLFLEKDYVVMMDFLAKSLNYQKIPFEWIVENESTIDLFKENLSKNINFQNKTLIEKLFLEKIIEIMTADSGVKSNFSKSIYIIKQYGLFLDRKAIKTLIKYSFFKK
ncbi:glycosyltransferase involved in cell wall biosynthesis [Flavobacterium sp. CG_23.5]|uniref:glycosyltransferase family 2 protein n=1 Tax=Flavobacterium sp. CG_23.5 TaxID=2760708 RepID=UPI001AE128A1|nr:glycosyltransferase [Flavobacterium sp. CG_23.5]MBP2283043.1 glycosyltransferase involved in cell wall biosynthesis [Flavobacterium sp. CG_23.5]